MHCVNKYGYQLSRVGSPPDVEGTRFVGICGGLLTDTRVFGGIWRVVEGSV
jgi:hypothetical protein